MTFGCVLIILEVESWSYTVQMFSGDWFGHQIFNAADTSLYGLECFSYCFSRLYWTNAPSDFDTMHVRMLDNFDTNYLSLCTTALIEALLIVLICLIVGIAFGMLPF